MNSIIYTKYEDLLTLTYTCIGIIFQQLDFDMELFITRIGDASQRQSFATRKAQIGNDEKELRRNNMRKGIAGDWKNHFSDDHKSAFKDRYGDTLIMLGYEKDNTW